MLRTYRFIDEHKKAWLVNHKKVYRLYREVDLAPCAAVSTGAA